jgi:hypothetical protein
MNSITIPSTHALLKTITKSMEVRLLLMFHHTCATNATQAFVI